MSGQWLDDLTKLAGKLVRDKIPEFIRAKGEIAHTRLLLPGERKPYTQMKILEEVTELLCARSREEIKNEAGDVIEVLRAYAALHKIPWDEIESARVKKRKIRGAFNDFICLLSSASQR
jgi:predicted house-cleaning noncanonical NTP pyrophosphatase (MazG superfamily)